MELTAALTRHLVDSTYEDLAPAAVDFTKRSILDTLGIMLPPTTIDPTYIRLHQLVKSFGGTPESTLIGFGGKTSSLWAAFLNGALCHGLDYDDTTDSPPHHPTASTLPVSLALAERRGGVTGKELITAIALANDFAIRLASAPNKSIVMDYPFFPITIFGTMASAVAGSKVLGLPAEQLRNALGLALHQASGVTEATMSPESDLRALRDGFTNKAGTMATLLAEANVTAVRSNSLEIFFRTFYGDDFSADRIVAQLGENNRSTDIALKPWPCDRETHGYIEGALALLEKHQISPDEIQGANLTVGRFGHRHLFEPIEQKRAPSRPNDAKLSLPFVIGLALTQGQVKIADFLPASLSNPSVLSMAANIEYEIDPDVGPPGTGTPAKIQLRMKDGRHFEFVVDTLLGHPKRPLSTEQVESKFIDCASYSASPLSEAAARELASKVWELEQVNDVGVICKLLG